LKSFATIVSGQHHYRVVLVLRRLAKKGTEKRPEKKSCRKEAVESERRSGEKNLLFCGFLELLRKMIAPSLEGIWLSETGGTGWRGKQKGLSIVGIRRPEVLRVNTRGKKKLKNRENRERGDGVREA